MSSLVNELYKLTNKYKIESFKSSALCRRFIFKLKDSEEPDGSLSFIDSNKLYDYDDTNESADNPDIRTYFKYDSIKGRFLKKDVKVCDIPVGILDRPNCTICNLSSSDYKDILLSINSLDKYRLDNGRFYKDRDGEYIYDSKNNKFYKNNKINMPVNDIFGKKFNPDDFFNAIGVMISVYKVIYKKENDTISGTYKISPENIELRIMSSNYFDISFSDSSSEGHYYIIEVNKACVKNKVNKACVKSSEISMNLIPMSFTKIENNIVYTNNSSSVDHTLYFDSKYCKYSNISNIESDTGNKNYIIKLKNSNCIDGSQLTIWLTGTESHSILVSHSDIDVEINGDSVDVSVPKSKYANATSADVYCFYNSDIISLNERTINDILSELNIKEYVDEPDDINKLIDYYPEYFRNRLETQCPTYYAKIDTIDRSSAIKYVVPDGTQHIPCIQLEIPIKHSSVMLFQDGRIITPYAYFEGRHTIYYYDSNNNLQSSEVGTSGNMYLYINIKELDESAYSNSVLYSTSKYKLINPIYIIRTNTYFNENVVFPLTMIDKYVSGNRYEINKYGDFSENDNGDYVNDSDTDTFYKIIKDGKNIHKYKKSYVKNGDIYKLTYIDDDNGEYYKVISNEYIIPVNKNLDINKLRIAIVQMEQISDDVDEITNKTYSLASSDDNSHAYWCVYIKTGDKYKKTFIHEKQLNDEYTEGPVEGLDGNYITITETDRTYYVKSSNRKPIRYKRTTYTYTNLINNFKYYNDSGDTGFYIKDGDNYVKKDKDFIESLRQYNQILKIHIENGEIIDCGFPNTDEYSMLIDLEDMLDADGKIIDAEYTIDLNSNATNIMDGAVIAYNVSDGYSQYYLNGEDDEFLSYVIPNQLMLSENKMMAFMNGYFTDEFIIDKHLYYRLFDGNTILAFSDKQSNSDIMYMYDENGNYVFDNGEYRIATDADADLPHFKKCVGSIYLTNPGNYTLYQDIHGISYKNGIFTLANTIDGCVLNENKLYSDFYMVPFSPKYMMLFINGRYIDSDHIKVLSNRKFALTEDIKNYFGLNDGEKLEINEMFIYKYDYLNLEKYKDYYSEPVQYSSACVYGLKDSTLDNKLDKLLTIDGIFTNIEINAKDIGFHQSNNLTALYEIFGKYVLNKYDIDSNDFELTNEIRSYFDLLYDRDGRMKFEKIEDNDKRKYDY